MMSGTSSATGTDAVDRHSTNTGELETTLAAMEIDEEHLPDLSSYFTRAYFWWKFAVWPVVWCAANGIVYAVNRKLNHDWPGMVYSMLFLLDAALLYLAANYVKRDVQALDDLPAEREGEGLSNGQHVHAQVSHKLDQVMGRRIRPSSDLSSSSSRSSSISVSLLLLGSVACATLALWSISEWTLARDMASQACEALGYVENDGASNNIVQIDIPGIPQELQDWAKSRPVYSDSLDRGSFGSLVHLVEGSTFLVSTEPSPLGTTSTSQTAEFSDNSVLAAIAGNGGQMKFLSQVRRPRSFVILSDDVPSDPLHAPGFCCLYDHKASNSDGSNPNGSIMCADSSDMAMLFSQGVVRNVTLDHYGGKYYHESSSLKLHANAVWIRVEWRVAHDYHVVSEYYTATVKEGQALRLVSVANVTTARDDNFYQGSSCDLLRYVQLAGFIVTMGLAAYWLRRSVQQLSMSVVPALGAVLGLCAVIDEGVPTATCAVAFVVAFAALFSNNAAFMARIGSEELVWLMYASIAFPIAVLCQEKGYGQGLAVAACVVFIPGSILGHPVVYLVGWIGGIVCVVLGLLTLLVRAQDWSLPIMVVGAIGGPGCATIGYMLHKYNAYMQYYARRVWRFILARISRAFGCEGH